MPEGTPPVTPRPAATIVVARPTDDAFDVLLLQRPLASRFAAGAYVFPGGAVDEADASPSLTPRLPPVSEPVACAAALRELFEETGILPAQTGFEAPSAELAEARQELLSDRVDFPTIADRFGMDFSDAAVTYFSRWITPRTLATRFDTRFFLLALAEPSVEVTLTREHDSAIWSDARQALRRFETGELPMLFPTRKTLERLATFHSLKDAFSALREVPVEPLLAKLRIDGDRIRPLMPGDPGYDETY